MGSNAGALEPEQKPEQKGKRGSVGTRTKGELGEGFWGILFSHNGLTLFSNSQFPIPIPNSQFPIKYFGLNVVRVVLNVQHHHARYRLHLKKGLFRNRWANNGLLLVSIHAD